MGEFNLKEDYIMCNTQNTKKIISFLLIVLITAALFIPVQSSALTSTGNAGTARIDYVTGGRCVAWSVNMKKKGVYQLGGNIKTYTSGGTLKHTHVIFTTTKSSGAKSGSWTLPSKGYKAGNRYKAKLYLAACRGGIWENNNSISVTPSKFIIPFTYK